MLGGRVATVFVGRQLTKYNLQLGITLSLVIKVSAKKFAAARALVVIDNLLLFYALVKICKHVPRVMGGVSLLSLRYSVQPYTLVHVLQSDSPACAHFFYFLIRHLCSYLRTWRSSVCCILKIGRSSFCPHFWQLGGPACVAC